MTMENWNKITVIGCGLIGASFALALKRERANGVVVAGWDESPAVLDEAVGRGVIDEVDDSFARGAISSSDLIYLAMPVEEIVRFLGERGEQVKPGAVITDAGSTKSLICRTAKSRLPADRQFIGGHPIAGSHLRGLRHARADLFADSPYVLVNNGESARPALDALKKMLDILGAKVAVMSAEEHDRAISFISHLPQIVSSALAAVVHERQDAEALLRLSGSGYRDMTRLAASSWSVWRGILATNSAQLAASLDSLIGKLSAARDELLDCEERGVEALKVTSELFADSGHPAESVRGIKTESERL